MRPEDLFKIIGGIDDALIAESEELYAGEAGRPAPQANMVGAADGPSSLEYSPVDKKETRPDHDGAEKGDRGPSSPEYSPADKKETRPDYDKAEKGDRGPSSSEYSPSGKKELRPDCDEAEKSDRGPSNIEYSPSGKKELRTGCDEAEKGNRGPSSSEFSPTGQNQEDSGAKAGSRGARRFRPRRWIPAVAAAACVLVGFAGLYALMRPKGSAMSEAAYEEAMVEEGAEEPMAEEAAEGAAEYAYEEAAPAAESASPSAEDKEEMSENFASEPTEEVAPESAEEDAGSGETDTPVDGAEESGGGSFSGDAADAAAVGVTLEASDVTSTGLTLTCTQSGGRVTGELLTGTAYTLEQLDPAYLKAYESGDDVPSDAWRAVEPLAEEIVWTEEGLPITLGGRTEWTVNWESLYGELDKGTYRICKQILDLRAPGDYDAYEAGAVFKVKE